jgi:signal transduction histidine kinase
MIPAQTASVTRSPRNAASLAMAEARSPLAQLLHALNQPLTGLQCSMEVALAGARTPEQYVRGLRQGLELTERMRALVEAIREVADVEEEEDESEDAGTTELNTVLREVADDLGPVAEVKSVCITLDCAAPSLLVRARRQRLAIVVFRFVESALSLAARGSALRIETGGAPAESWIRIHWHAGGPRAEFSRAELGLLVAQAGWEQAGAEWNRERNENLETVTIRLATCSNNSHELHNRL